MALSDDLIAQVVSLMAKSFRSDRKDAKRLASTQEQVIAKETGRRVAQMRESAEQARKAAFISGVSMMAGGALQATGAGMSLGASRSTTTSSSVTGADGVTTTSQLTKQSANWSAFGEAASTATQGLGKPFAGIHEDASRAADEAAVMHEAAADRSKRAGEEYRNDADDARRMLDKVAEFLKSVRDSQSASTQAAIRRA